MTQQSITSALGMNKGPQVAASGGKGQFSGQQSRQDGMGIDGEDGDGAEATGGVNDRASKAGKSDGSGSDTPDFDSLLQQFRSKQGNAKSGDGDGDGEKTDADIAALTDASAPSDGSSEGDDAETVLAKLLEGLNKGETGGDATQQANVEAAAALKAAAQSAGANVAATGSQNSNDGLASALPQPATGQTAGSAVNGEVATGKAGLFDAYSVETKSVSAFDKIVPVVKEAVLTPSQKALRDGFTVLRQETHFAPTASIEASNIATANSVFQQIGTAIANDLMSPSSAKADGPATSNPAQPAQPGGFRVASGGDALRVLDIQLHPADLGKVRLSIRLNDTSVDVRVEASNAATAKILEGNKQLLDQMLSKAGLSRRSYFDCCHRRQERIPDHATVHQQQRPEPPGQQGQSGAFNGGGNAQSGGGENQQQSSAHGDDLAGASVDMTSGISDEGQDAQSSQRSAKGITL